MRVSPAMTLPIRSATPASIARWVSDVITAGFVLRDARLDELPHQRRGEGLVDGEANGPLDVWYGGERLLEGLRESGAHEQAAVLLERGVTHEHAVVLEHRDAVADDLGRLGGGGPDRLAQLLERGPRAGGTA